LSTTLVSPGRHLKGVTLAGLKRALACTLRDILAHHTLQVAAALSYYFILAVFPGLIFLSAVMGSIPLPDLFGHVLVLMSHLLPPDTMKVVVSVLTDVLAANRKTWLSVGMLGMIWITSAAFDATIEALDIAYDVHEDRPFWKTRLLAIALSAIDGGLLMAALAVMIVGPRFGGWLAGRIYLSYSFVLLWPTIHWVIAIAFTVLSVEAVYYLGPNIKQRFLATLPGAILTVTCWIGVSDLLGIYFRHFANYNRTYGTLGGFVAFMIWFYWMSFALLVGAELNAELAKESKKGQLPPKEQPATGQSLDRAA
jgi:membrane protein